ncbi:MAG: hypothetical protein ABL911_12780 [Gallionella sp.]
MFQYPLTRHSPHWGKKTWRTQLIWLLLGLCALMVEMIKPAHASDVAPVRVDWYQQQIPGRFFPTSLDAMKAYLPIIWQQNGCGGVGWACYPLDGSGFTVTKYPIRHFYTANPQYYWNNFIVDAAVQCPANATLSIVSERGYVSSVNFPAINIPASCTCYAGVPDATATSCVLQCPAGQQLNAAGTACVVTPVCPAHAHATNLPTPPCACYAGYVWDATQTSCVLDCPIPDLTPMTDALALDFEKGNTWRPDLLTTPYQIKLNCVKAGFTTQGWTFVPTNGSAFRPNQYQRHFYELVAKDGALKAPNYMSTHPECQSLRTKITAEMAKHGLKPGQPVGKPGTSHHESGQAFDITPMLATGGSPSKQQVFPVYNACGVSNTKVPAEKWHVE